MHRRKRPPRPSASRPIIAHTPPRPGAETVRTGPPPTRKFGRRSSPGKRNSPISEVAPLVLFSADTRHTATARQVRTFPGTGRSEHRRPGSRSSAPIQSGRSTIADPESGKKPQTRMKKEGSMPPDTGAASPLPFSAEPSLCWGISPRANCSIFPVQLST